MSDIMGECIVTCAPSGEARSFPGGTLLAEALFEMGMITHTPCGGKGICRKCRVRVAGPVKQKKEAHERTLDSTFWVLACQYRIASDLTVYTQPEHGDETFPLAHVNGDHVYGVAVDIGTTTVRMSLVDTVTNRSKAIASFLNPQRKFGHDVISRITAGTNPGHMASLRDKVRKSVNIHLKKALHELGVSAEKIENIVFSGNTTMLYLLFGLDVMPLGQFPYTSPTQDFPPCHARDLGLGVIGAARVLALPVCGAFTGGDLMGALALCVSLGYSRHIFFMDLGTNGELFVLDGSGKPFVASCAMGPSLEGMNISSGMTAYEGAVTHIREQHGALAYTMIGEGIPCGITGTALIDLMAILLDHGIISNQGAFVSQIDEKHLLSPLRFHHTGNAKQLSLWGQIGLTQKDIRQVQLAKTAAHTAALLLMQAAGLNLEDIEHVIIAGAFGEYVDLEHLRRLGFLPDFFKASKIFMGNASLRAAEKACLDPAFMDSAAALRSRCHELPLSMRPEFRELFLRSLGFEQ